MRYELLYNHMHQIISEHVFEDPSGQTLKSRNLKDLVNAVIRFREINGLPPGDPEQEIATKYATKYPWLVREDLSGEKVPQNQSLASGEAIWRWVQKVWNSPPKLPLLTPEKYSDRAQICRSCPHNLEFNARLEGGAELVRRIYILGRGDGAADCGRCDIQGWLNSLAVMLPDAAERAEVLTIPDHCWLMTEQAASKDAPGEEKP